MRKINLAKRYGMRYPSIDQLLERSESKYRLVIGAAMRAKEIQKHNETLIETSCVKPVGRALEEIISGDVEIIEKG